MSLRQFRKLYKMSIILFFCRVNLFVIYRYYFVVLQFVAGHNEEISTLALQNDLQVGILSVHLVFC